jgi:hypothetical protein
MVLILKYRLDPPEALNRDVYEALKGQVGRVGITLQLPLGEDADGPPLLVVRGDFISVEGEHFEAPRDFPVPMVDDNAGEVPG